MTAASAFTAVAVPPLVEPPVVQHEGALKTKQNRLVKNIILGFRVHCKEKPGEREEGERGVREAGRDERWRKRKEGATHIIVSTW